MCLSGDIIMIPLVSLISTVAWASNSRDSSSVVPVRAAWCSAEKLWAKHRTIGGREGRGKREENEMRWVINHTDDLQQVKPTDSRDDMCALSSKLHQNVWTCVYNACYCMCVCLCMSVSACLIHTSNWDVCVYSICGIRSQRLHTCMCSNIKTADWSRRWSACVCVCTVSCKMKYVCLSLGVCRVAVFPTRGEIKGINSWQWVLLLHRALQTRWALWRRWPSEEREQSQSWNTYLSCGAKITATVTEGFQVILQSLRQF